MKKVLLVATLASIGATACSNDLTTDPSNQNAITVETIAQKWQLAMVDDQTISAEGAPTLTVSTDMVASGYTGCNRYFGNAQLENNRFRIDRMASTRMACASQAMDMEFTVSDVLSDWSQINITDNQLTLANDKTTLTFNAVQSNTTP
ncbi:MULTISPECIES: META domain-containing protein [unclassified Salinivibrio]|uniref:META domain-containing protein n=1 Tax=unclassified Salinivibrio TaxID=2636825 RepID=UPI0009843A11|nr:MULTISPECIES: META domain-containing protein [unclassified Salinivibrio]